MPRPSANVPNHSLWSVQQLCISSLISLLLKKSVCQEMIPLWCHTLTIMMLHLGWWHPLAYCPKALLRTGGWSCKICNFSGALGFLEVLKRVLKWDLSQFLCVFTPGKCLVCFLWGQTKIQCTFFELVRFSFTLQFAQEDLTTSPHVWDWSIIEQNRVGRGSTVKNGK